MKKKVKTKKTWTITETTYEDGSINLGRENNGFTAIEILGIASLASLEITALFSNIKEYETIKRIIKERRK